LKLKVIVEEAVEQVMVAWIEKSQVVVKEVRVLTQGQELREADSFSPKRFEF